MTATRVKTPANMKRAYLLPGLPHLTDAGTGWNDLKQAYATVAENIKHVQPEVIVIYSSQWVSVLGHSFQADPNPKGLHVDENWYEFDDFNFNFKIDTELTTLAEEKTKAKGLATKLINYDGFPVDTGTLVALKHINPDNTIPVVILSSNIYAGRKDTETLAQSVHDAVAESGKKAVFVAISSLSHHFHTQDITPETDSIADASEDTWNKKILGLMEDGKNDAVAECAGEFAKQARAEMQFKAFYWLNTVSALNDTKATVHAYGPVWGTGNAVVEYILNT